ADISSAPRCRRPPLRSDCNVVAWDNEDQNRRCVADYRTSWDFNRGDRRNSAILGEESQGLPVISPTIHGNYPPNYSRSIADRENGLSSGQVFSSRPSRTLSKSDQTACA